MSKFLHVLLHVVLTVAQFGNAFLKVVPAPYNALAAAILAVIQASLALYNHKS